MGYCQRFCVCVNLIAGQSIYTRPNSGWYCKWGDASTASWLAHWDTFPVNGIDGTWESEYADVTVTTMETTPYIDFRMRASDDDLEFYNYEVPFHSRWMGPSDADGSDETYICRIQIPEPCKSVYLCVKFTLHSLL